MDFYFLRISTSKLLGLILAGGLTMVLAMYGLAVFDKYSSFLSAGVATILFFGGGWLFNRGLCAAQELISVTVSANELTELNQQTGQRRRWGYAEITAYRLLPEVRSTVTLRLTLRGSRRTRLNASDLSFTGTKSIAQFRQMVQAFGAAWRQYQQASAA